MDSEAIINALVADLKPPRRHLWLQLSFAVAASAFLAGCIFFTAFGLRANYPAVLAMPRAGLKLALVAALAAVLGPLVFRGAAPLGLRPPNFRRLGLVLLLWIAAIAGEAIMSPQAEWGRLAMGDNNLFCLAAIPLIGLPVLVATLAVLQAAAPADAGISGALAGLFSGSVSALIYSMHCPDDSPFFVALWYGLAMLGLTVLGMLAGRKVLRW